MFRFFLDRVRAWDYNKEDETRACALYARRAEKRYERKVHRMTRGMARVPEGERDAGAFVPRGEF